MLTVIALAEAKWFYLPSDLQNIFVRMNAEDTNFLIVCLIALFSFIQFVCIKNNKRNFMFKPEVLTIWFIFFISIFYATIKYGQEISYSFRVFNYFGVYLLYFSSLLFFDKYRMYHYFESVFMICAFVFSTLIVIQVLLWKENGVAFLTVLSLINDIQETDFTLSTRFGYTRILSPATFLLFWTIVAFAKLLQTEKKSKADFILYSVCLFAGTLYIFTSGTRGLMISYLFSFATIIFCRNSSRGFFKTIVLLGIVITLILLVSENEFIERLEVDRDTTSYENRLGAYSYFLMQGISNPFIGLGLLTDHVPQYATLLHGPTLRYYISDVGIVGFAGQMGIIAALAYFSIILKTCYECYSCKKLTGQFDLVLVGISTYLISTAFTFSLQLNNTIIGMVLSLIVVQYRKDQIVQAHAAELPPSPDEDPAGTEVQPFPIVES